MKAVTRFVRKWWWLILLGVAVVFAIVWQVLKGKSGTAPIDDLVVPKKTFVEKARDEVEKVHLEAEVEKAKVRAEAKSQMEQIKAIEEKGKTEPKKAREDLAAFLSANL